jgi:hypothetical protein
MLVLSIPILRSLHKVFFWALCSVTLSQNLAHAFTESLDSDRPEAWAMNYYTSVTLFTGFGTPHSREFGSIELGGELDWLPQQGIAERRVGFNGTKLDDLNKAPIFARPHLTLGLPWNFALSLSYLPPIRIFGVEPHLFAFAIERPIYERRPWTFGVRAHGQIGTIDGAYTCSKDNTKFPAGSPQNPLGCELESNDTVTQNYGGLELSGSYRIERLRGLTPYLTVGGNFLSTKFQTRASYNGIRDRARMVADTWTFSATAGITYPLSDRLSLSIGLFYSPLWVVRPPGTSSQNDPLFNVRSQINFLLR